MAGQQDTEQGPDLALGIAVSEFPASGVLRGHVGGDGVLLARRGDALFAIGSSCTHYSGPLAAGVLEGDTVRCPWHHACFSLRTGEALRAPAFDPVPCWDVETRDGRIFVAGRKAVRPATRRDTGPSQIPARIVIIGGGAAGFAAAEMLRRERYEGSIVMLSADAAAPVDRPNLSKDFLAGTASEDWLPLRPDEWYRRNGIDLRLDTPALGIDIRSREVEVAGGDRLAYDRLLLATGAEPIGLDAPGSDRSHVHTLRTLDDCRAIIRAAESARSVVVVGASFIGLEVAAALRMRGLEVHVVARDKRPLERVFGAEIGDVVRRLHEDHGVVFHLEDSVARIEPTQVRLQSGAMLSADFVVAGIGVRPRLALAEKAGLTLERGVLVDACLQTSAPGIFAAGDIVRWPDARSDEAIRVEHWVVAERQGQTAARNMLGWHERHADVPFFWSQHYDVPINYVGHASDWDTIEIDGDVQQRDCVVRYLKRGAVRAVATIHRDIDSLRAEVAMESAVGAGTASPGGRAPSPAQSSAAGAV